jgi:N6-L-threonylcarbamoyladenine synthase
MNILGIETSCDETGASIVRNGEVILSNVVVSSLKTHALYGGIIPEIASRRQLECIFPVVEESLSAAGLSLNQIDKIAVTTRPGLIGSLLVGSCFASALAFALKKKVIEVDHIKAHIYANFLRYKDDKNFKKPKLPAVGLVVSGGHSSLYNIKSVKNFKMLGETRDDAAGEAFDKVAKILDLGYPGGPVIDKLAKEGKPSRIKFSSYMENDFNFSFSGIKTAVLYYKRDHVSDDYYNVKDVAYAFQESVIGSLVKKSILACHKMKSKTLMVGGGVAANSRLRAWLTQECQENNIHVFFPPLNLCLDNAAMIAGLGYHS